MASSAKLNYTTKLAAWRRTSEPEPGCRMPSAEPQVGLGRIAGDWRCTLLGLPLVFLTPLVGNMQLDTRPFVLRNQSL